MSFGGVANANLLSAKEKEMEFDNLKNLSNQAMVAATKPWVEPGEANSALAGIKETAGCLDKIRSAERPAPPAGDAVIKP